MSEMDPQVLAEECAKAMFARDRASQKLGTEHLKVVREGESGSFGMEVLNIGLEQQAKEMRRAWF